MLFSGITVYYDSERTYAEARVHPYAAGAKGQSGYIDLKAEPERIDSALEDFAHFSNWRAVQTFYSFLRWVNGPESHLETNDSALRQPGPHNDSNSNLSLSMHGRVFVLYRDLRFNASPDHSDWLCGRLMQHLREFDPNFSKSEGVVGFTLTPVIQVAISKGFFRPDGLFDVAENDPGIGKHLMLSFWAYGNTDSEVFANLDRVFSNIWAACRSLSADIDDGLRQQSTEPPGV